MANVKVSMNLDFIVSAENEDEAEKKIMQMIGQDKLNVSLQVDKSVDRLTDEESNIFDSMEMEHDSDGWEVQDVELVEDE